MGFANELIRIRSYLSLTAGNAEAIELLIGKDGSTLLARLIDTTITHLGHDESRKAFRGPVASDPTQPNSHSMRAAKRVAKA